MEHQPPPVATVQWQCSQPNPIIPDDPEFAGCRARRLVLGGCTWAPHALDLSGHAVSTKSGRGGGGAVELNVIEDVHSSGPGGRIWDAAVVLAEFLASKFGCEGTAGDGGKRKEWRGGMRGLEVLEVGAGTGLAGLVCAKLGAQVVTSRPTKTLLRYEKTNIFAYTYTCDIHLAAVMYRRVHACRW